MRDLNHPPALTARRIGFAVLNVATCAGLVVLLALGFGPLPWSLAQWAALVCLALCTPWNVLCFWNGILGGVLLFTPGSARRHLPRDPASPIVARIAILMTIRNEEPERALARFRIIAESLDATGAGGQFGFFVLSDTSDAIIAAREEAAFAVWRNAQSEPARFQYRRRSSNAGFKAGNVMEFCDRWGGDYDVMIPLDADSLMSGPAILRLVRLMQDNPRLGIVQGLVTGIPAPSAFARLFQFGMRAGMRSHTLGLEWWTGDCGPFWGHNAAVRIAPFREHCRLWRLPGKPPFGGDILSHDQVEAVLMRRAGYEVRLMPVAGGSWEENPPTLVDYIKRDLRWCQGNLQYVPLLRTPGLKPVSRFQLFWAILMFAGIPAWVLLTALLAVLAATMAPPDAGARAALVTLYVCWLVLWFGPRLAGYAQSLSCRAGAYGGRLRIIAGAAVECVFSLLHFSVTSLATTAFIIGMLGSALLGGGWAGWRGQARDSRRVTWGEAATMLWPQTLFGLAVNGGILLAAPALLPWALPFTAGTLLAIPLAVATASAWLGGLMRRIGICALPEEIAPPPELAALGIQPWKIPGG